MMLEILENEGCGWMVRTEDGKDVGHGPVYCPFIRAGTPHEHRTEYLYMLHSHVHFIQLAIISIHFFYSYLIFTLYNSGRAANAPAWDPGWPLQEQ